MRSFKFLIRAFCCLMEWKSYIGTGANAFQNRSRKAHWPVMKDFDGNMAWWSVSLAHRLDWQALWAESILRFSQSAPSALSWPRVSSHQRRGTHTGLLSHSTLATRRAQDSFRTHTHIGYSYVGTSVRLRKSVLECWRYDFTGIIT